MLKILHFIFGRLYFQVKGYQTERFLNLCAKNHLVLWELKPVSDGYVFFIRRSSYQMLEALAEKANVDLTLQGQKGLPYFLKEHKKRKILFFSMCLCGLMILSLSQFLWEITVSGGEVYSESDILKYVTDNYYHIGTLKYQIDCDALEDHLREDYAEIAWASCSIQGTRLHIEIKETLDRKTKQNPKKPCDIVANKSGIITKMAVKSGTPLVSVGDSVKSGTTLISGLIYYYSDDFTVTQTDKIKADGEIVMRTKEVYNINSAFSPDTVVMASISRTWFHSESKPDVTIRNAKVELYIDGIFKEEMPWKEYSYWKSSRWLGEDRGGWVTDTLYISNTVPQPGQTVKIVASTPEYGTASAEDKIPSKTEIKGLRIIPRKEATGNGGTLVDGDGNISYIEENDVLIYQITFQDTPGKSNYYSLQIWGDDDHLGVLLDFSVDPVFTQQQGILDEVFGSSMVNWRGRVFSDELFDGKEYMGLRLK